MSEAGFPEARRPGEQPKITKLADFSAEALGELVQYLNGQISVPITQILGFSQFTAQRNFVATDQTTSSVTYTNLTTTGPTISGLPDGRYLVLVSGKLLNDTAGKDSWMSPSVNGATPSDNDAALLVATAANFPQATLVGISLQTLSGGGNNSIAAKYRVGGGIGTFGLRNLVALRYANL